MGSEVENVVATPISEAVRQHEACGSGFVGGTSPAMLTLEAVVSEIAHTNIPVLLVGECGTGKQMFAHRIHQLSDRPGPLMKISCAGMRAESNTGAKQGRHSSMKSVNSMQRAKGIFCTRCLTERQNRNAEF
jgi:DNA-binding NtrC family response regulator